MSVVMPDDIRILIAEDHPFFRDGLRRALATEAGF
jgi:DNA-binding NarL/FixJ family response regulator